MCTLMETWLNYCHHYSNKAGVVEVEEKSSKHLDIQQQQRDVSSAESATLSISVPVWWEAEVFNHFKSFKWR